MNDLEHKLQVNCVRYFRYQFPDKLIFAVPNGAQRNIVTARKLKDEGVLAGIPDLVIASANDNWHGLYIELKNGKAGRVSDHQYDAMQKLTEEGYRCAVVRTFEEFVAVVQDYFGEEEIQERIANNRERAIARIEQAALEAKRSYKAQVQYEAALRGNTAPIVNDKMSYLRPEKPHKREPKCNTEFDLPKKQVVQKSATTNNKPCDCL